MKNLKYILLTMLILITACSSTDASDSNENGGTVAETVAVQTNGAIPARETSGDNKPELPTPSTELNTIRLSDNNTTYSNSGITVANNTVTISEGGSYKLSGKLSNGKIVINTSEKTHLILNGVSVTNPETPAIEFIGTGNAVIEIADRTTNELSDTKVKKKERTNEDAVIHSNSSVEIIGNGTLNITGESRSTIYAANNITVQSGTLNLVADYEGIACDGELIINGGIIDIEAKDDALNAENNLVINDGYIYTVTKGDGIDSNGDMTINGGELYIFAANKKNSALDVSDGDVYGNFFINGGTVVAAGGNNPITVDHQSSQGYSWIESPHELGKKNEVAVRVVSENGDELIRFTAPKGFELLFVSTAKLTSDSNMLRNCQIILEEDF